MKVSPLFAWYDFWVGFYWDREQRKLYFLPLPMIGLVFDFEHKAKHADVPVESLTTKWCSYPKCKSLTGSTWDDRCIEHSYRVDGGRP